MYTRMRDYDVLLGVDLQNDFMPGGALAVPRGNEVVRPFNVLARRAPNVILSKDWHTVGHISFASTHGRVPREVIDLPYGKQVLWPEHCVQGTRGAQLHRGLRVPHVQLLLHKGYRSHVDSYSAFYEADGTPTGLTGYLRERKIKRIFMGGLATDFCVKWCAIDGRKDGFEVFVIEDACRAIDLNNSLVEARNEMLAAGVRFITTEQIV